MNHSDIYHNSDSNSVNYTLTVNCLIVFLGLVIKQEIKDLSYNFSMYNKVTRNMIATDIKKDWSIWKKLCCKIYICDIQ